MKLEAWFLYPKSMMSPDLKLTFGEKMLESSRDTGFLASRGGTLASLIDSQQSISRWSELLWACDSIRSLISSPWRGLEKQHFLIVYSKWTLQPRKTQMNHSYRPLYLPRPSLKTGSWMKTSYSECCSSTVIDKFRAWSSHAQFWHPATCIL